jgi:hypothetical protein
MVKNLKERLCFTVNAPKGCDHDLSLLPTLFQISVVRLALPLATGTRASAICLCSTRVREEMQAGYLR